MCGIVAILRRPAVAPSPDLAPLIAGLARHTGPLLEGPEWTQSEEFEASRALGEMDRVLASPAGLVALLENRAQVASLTEQLDRVTDALGERELALDDAGLKLSAEETERRNASLLGLKDLTWSIRRDRLEAAVHVNRLAQGARHLGAITVLTSVHQVLRALDRLEVRGRDSAGIVVHLKNHGLDLESGEVARVVAKRAHDPLYQSGSVGLSDGILSMVWKTAAEIGELGDNVRRLRSAIENDELLRLALRGEQVEAAVLGHTRWASVGLISEPNCHPLNEERHSVGPSTADLHYPGVVAVLNGDVDNYADLKASGDLSFAEEITTDAKVIPVMISDRLASGRPPIDAFRDTVSSFAGSVAIASILSSDPERLYLALRGSGQALYVGLGEDCFVAASEPYGVVEVTATYLRLDGETPGNPASPSASRGQIVVLDGSRAGSLEGVSRVAYDGTPLAIERSELTTAQITTRDVDRGDYPHFLLKEITESSRSFEKTLRGKLLPEPVAPCASEAPIAGRRRSSAVVELGSDTLPDEIVDRIGRGEFHRILVIGQGTAAVAGQGVARAIEETLAAREVELEVRALPATELSGFHLAADMSDTLVVAISQSGTTTDTNRTVDLIRGRGARVLSIVNRRHSDLTDKSDGVLYTSDGRDVEMSVASTKAFYSQIAAGFLLAQGIADAACDRPPSEQELELLRGLRDLPRAMESLLERSDHIAKIASRLAPAKRYWAVVGNGWNRIAAEEVRIKLSELCYKSIACDATEDKKHIDLSAEPLILVCAAGLRGSNADDIAKEVAIYRAHKATPIVVASDGDQRYAEASEVIFVPAVHPSLAFVLAALSGHLFGYYAALAIDAQAVPLRQIRSSIERLSHRVLSRDLPTREPPSQSRPSAADVDLLAELRRATNEPASRFLRDLDGGAYNGHLEASTAVRVAILLRFVHGQMPVDAYPALGGRGGSPAVVIEDLTLAVTRAIEELTRPIDAIKHQAKTVTVGISRSDESLLLVPLVSAVFETVDRDHIGYSDLKTLAALDPVIEKVLGFTRYRIDGDPAAEDCSLNVIETGGLSRNVVSRTRDDSRLKGTKHRVATEKRLLAARGQSDGRTFVILPEIDGARVRGLALFFVQFAAQAPAPVLRGVLQGYRNRYSLLRDAVTETEPTFREDFLERLSVEQILLDPISVLARHWRPEAGPER